MAEPISPALDYFFVSHCFLFGFFGVLGVLNMHPPTELYVQAMDGFDGKGVSLVNEDKDWLTVFSGVWHQEECSDTLCG